MLGAECVSPILGQRCRRRALVLVTRKGLVSIPNTERQTDRARPLSEDAGYSTKQQRRWTQQQTNKQTNNGRCRNGADRALEVRAFQKTQHRLSENRNRNKRPLIPKTRHASNWPVRGLQACSTPSTRQLPICLFLTERHNIALSLNPWRSLAIAELKPSSWCSKARAIIRSFAVLVYATWRGACDL